MGHELVGLVEAVGSDVRTARKGDLVAAPFAWSDGTCEFCQQGLQTSAPLATPPGLEVRRSLGVSKPAA
jgi:D-arabinose 1-dehydrogenase-like Zn-dependent alcohol dehydrogenase